MKLENTDNGYVLHVGECIRHTLPILYKKTTTGAIQQWQISVYKEDGHEHPYIAIIWGQVEGRKQLTTEDVVEGKNIGKINETTPWGQALSQMQSEWEKRKKKGYVETISDAEKGKIDSSVIKGGIVPMTAHVYQKQGHKIKFPAIAQPKLDGHRSTSQKEYDENNLFDSVSLWSRSRKKINSIPHICQALELTNWEKLDGELYNHDYKENFEDLTSLIKQDEPAPGYEAVQFHVYDLPHPSLTNYQRYEILEGLRSTFEGTPIHIVESIIVNNSEELKDAYIHFMEQGYEGAMVRNFDGLYVNKRSYDLQKYKEFEDDEFEIIDIKVGTKGKMKGLGIFVCKTKDGNTFDCKMKGKLDELKQYADDPNIAIGRQLTVQFQGYTKKNNVPRFPVGLRFREDI